MPKTQPPSNGPGNQLLSRLPMEAFQKLLPRLKTVPLEFKSVLYEAESAIDYAYFPTSGVISAVTVMEDGSSIEVTTVGKEGMVGLPVVLEAEASPNRVLVQVAGEGLRMQADDLRAEIRHDGALRKLLV